MSRRADIRANVAGRLDRVLAESLPELSRRGARRLISEGAVFLDGKRCRVASRSVGKGARLVVHLDGVADEQDRPFSVVYEDERMIVVDKAPGVHVNETETTAARSLVDRLSAVVVHRIDKGTSGLVVLAKDKATAAQLSEAFRARRVEKHYLAVCVGRPKEGLIEAPIGRDPKRPRARIVRPDGKPARTRVRVLSSAEEVSAVAAELLTGRTHQIRVHLAHLGAPILGDLVYGGPVAARVGDARVRADRPMLHAHRLNLPLDGAVLRLEAPLPVDFRALERHGLAFEAGSPIASLADEGP